jgi:WD40 repeat protein
LKLWAVEDGSLVRDFGMTHSDTILALAFSPDGGRLLTGGADRFGRIVDLATGAVTRNLEGHIHHVLGVAWSRDGRRVATAGAEGVVKIWNPMTGERLKNIDGFGKETTGIQPVGIADLFLAVSGSGDARLFKAGGEEVRRLGAGDVYLEAVAVTPDGTTAAAGDSMGGIHVWSLEDGRRVADFSAASGYASH